MFRIAKTEDIFYEVQVWVPFKVFGFDFGKWVKYDCSRDTPHNFFYASYEEAVFYLMKKVEFEANKKFLSQ